MWGTYFLERPSESCQWQAISDLTADKDHALLGLY